MRNWKIHEFTSQEPNLYPHQVLPHSIMTASSNPQPHSLRDRILDSFKSIFGNLGEFVERRPKATIFLSILVSILFGLFAGGVQLETEGVDLWIPTSSQTYKNFLEYIEIFNSGNKLNFIMFIISAKDQSSVFTQDVLKDVMSVHKDLTENLKNLTNIFEKLDKTF